MIVFLGNPGKQYEKTRHNAGWMVSSDIPTTTPWKVQFQALVSSMAGPSGTIRLLKPQTFMNESGTSVQQAMKFYNLSPDEVLVVNDDLELPFGTVRLQLGGGLQGHNGLKSIKQRTASDGFYRVRVGIGRPARGDVASYVLSRFTVSEEISLPLVLDLATSLIHKAIFGPMPALPDTLAI